MPPAYLRAPSLLARKPVGECTAPAPKGKRRGKNCPQCGQKHEPAVATARTMARLFGDGGPR